MAVNVHISYYIVNGTDRNQTFTAINWQKLGSADSDFPEPLEGRINTWLK